MRRRSGGCRLREAGPFPCCAVPMVRQIPLGGSPTTKWRVVAGEFLKPAAWCALVIEVRRRVLVLSRSGVQLRSHSGKDFSKWFCKYFG